MAFSIADAFVNIRAQADDGSVSDATHSMGSTLTKWATGLGLGALVSKGLADNLDAKEANAKLTAQMGLTKDVASNMGKLSGEVYRDNFGESVGDVNEAIKGVGQNMVDLGSTSKTEIKGMTEAALGLSSTFDLDVNESTKAAGQLMKNGLAKDGKEAFDIITKGMQMGLNSSGDFLDTITEYSPQFTKLGIDGPAALGLLSQGLKAGAKDTDVIADAFKEFSLRAIDGSKSTVDAYKSLGLSADKTSAAIAKGGPTAQKATGQVIDALKNVKDPQEQNRIGVELFGTQWEDTLRQILPGLDLNKAKLTDVDGATKNMNDTMGNTPTAKMETLKRHAEGLLQAAVGLPGPFGQLSAAVVSFGPSLLTMGGSLALIGPAMLPAITATWAWTTALLANPITWIVIGIIALVAAIVLIATKTDWFQKLWSMAWTGIKAAWDTVWGGLKTGFSALGTFFTKTIPGWLTSLGGKFTGAWKSIQTKTSEAMGAVKTKISQIWSAIVAYVAGKLSDFLGKIKGAWGSAKTFIAGAGSAILGSVRTAFQNVVTSVGQKVGDAVEKVKSIKGKVTGFFSGAGSWLYSAGKHIISGLIDGISGMIGSLKDKLGGVTKLIPSWKGPMDVDLQLLQPSGQAIMTGLMTGIDSQVPSLQGQLGGITAAIPGSVAASPAAGSSGGGGITVQNLTLNLDGTWDLKNPSQNKAAAKLLAKNMVIALRDQEKERR